MTSQIQILRQAKHNHEDLSDLERFLINPSAPLPSVELLERTRLAAYAYTKVPRQHPDKLALRPAFVKATRRHQQTKATLLPLLKTWHAEGIEVLPFKGFDLAEFVYDAPAQRFYGDVDVLIDPQHAATARRIATALGWSVATDITDSAVPYVHELMSLRSPDGQVFLEVHRRILQNYVPYARLQQRLTEAAWASSVSQAWEGIVVRRLDPPDSILLGLVLNRFWSADLWTLRPHDPLDMQQVMTRYTLSTDDLHRRADELGCRRTLDVFLSRCEPSRGVLTLTPPDYLQRQRWSRQILRERGHPGLERILGKALRIPGTAVDLVRAIPHVIRVVALIKRQSDIRVVLQRLDRPVEQDTRPSNAEQQRVIRGVRWALRLLRVRPGGNCLPRSLAIFTMLRRRGYPAIFCSGVRREAGSLQGHAWVELEGRVLEDLRESANRYTYRLNIEYPPSAV